MHYPTDVLAGVVLGLVNGFIAFIVVDKIYKIIEKKIISYNNKNNLLFYYCDILTKNKKLYLSLHQHYLQPNQQLHPPVEQVFSDLRHVDKDQHQLLLDQFLQVHSMGLANDVTY